MRTQRFIINARGDIFRATANGSDMHPGDAELIAAFHCSPYAQYLAQ